MRYFEITKPPARDILAGTDQREATIREPYGGTRPTAREWGTETVGSWPTGAAILSGIAKPYQSAVMSAAL